MKLKMKSLIYFQIIFSLWLNFLNDTLGIPAAIGYIGDLINGILIIGLFQNGGLKRISQSKANIVLIPVIALIIFSLISAFINVENPLYLIWGIRNNYRYFIFWLICFVVFDAKYYEKLFKILAFHFHLNIVFVLIQHFIFGLEQDFLGGIFGTGAGSNGRANIFLCIALCYCFARYLYKKCKLGELVYVLASCMVIAVYAEMKFLFIEMVLIVLFAILFARPSRKSVMIVGAGLIGLVAGLNLLQKFDPYTYSIVTSVDKLISYGNMESGGYNISRLGAFSTINKLFFQNSIVHNLFGYGLGNCDTSNIAIFNTPFYRNYGGLHYTWFSHQQWFLEGGYICFACLLIFFISYIVYSLKNRKLLYKFEELIVFICTFSTILVVNLWYNNSLRLECAYISFACLALLPGIMRAESKIRGEI